MTGETTPGAVFEPGTRFARPDLFRLAAGKGPTVMSGVAEGALSFLAGLLPRALGRRVALILPSDQIADAVAQDAGFHARVLAGTRPPLLLPALEPEPYMGVPPHLQVVVARTLALHEALVGDGSAILVPAEALLLRVPPPAVFRKLVLELEIGDPVDRDSLVRELIDAGYRRQDLVGSVGEVAVRGGIIDVYSPAAAAPYRIELFGDEVEGIRVFDPVSQRSDRDADRAILLPLVPFPLGDDADARLREWGANFTDAARDDLRAKRETLKTHGSFPGHEYYAPVFAGPLVPLTSYFDGFAIVVSEPATVIGEFEKSRAALEHVYRDVRERGHAVPTPDELALGVDEFRALIGAADLHLNALADDPHAEVALHAQPARTYDGRIKEVVADLMRDRELGNDAAVVVPSQAEAERVEAMLTEYEVPYLEGDAARSLWDHDRPPPRPGAARVAVVTGRLSRGFRSPPLQLSIYAAPEVFGGGLPPIRRRRRGAAVFASDFRDLKVGDHVVHVDHGVAKFVGLKTVAVGDSTQEFMVLEYHGDDKLYVPLDRLDLVQKYNAVEGLSPRVDSLGGTSWARVKKKIKSDLREMATELLNLYATRKVMEGYAFSPDGLFQKEFEDAFAYVETPDQLTAIAETKVDMESTRCMDRLLCGDVGYGKTEVSMRAAFKAVADGKQVAVLAPTTILAMQHERTFRERFAAFPITIEMISRFRTKPQIDASLEKAAKGSLDILIGTHRLLSKDVKFRDLGLLVVDEEQRFGVAHKEKLKQLRKGVDVLTMSATPIPRTLQMSLVGLRDMSVIETPPRDRLAIETSVVHWSGEVIKEGIKRELERGGQVFFVHNRVESIYAIADALRKIAPFARYVVGHGQMKEHELERVMVGFMDRQFDVLIATTIIENGLDMPNCNTMFINRAHRLGLSQLYQLRGRVGRSDRPAYAYLMTPAKTKLSPVARRRLHAIQEFSDLGAGFRIAALDLEIRGAGSLLGRQQHGHIAAVGLDMFMDLLAQTVRELKGDVVSEVNTQISLGVDVSIPIELIADSNHRLMLYKRIAGARLVVELDELETETADRYGQLPPAVKNLFDSARLKLEAQACGIQVVERDGRKARFKLGPEAKLDTQAVVAFVTQGVRGRKVHPDGRIEFPVSPGPDAIEEIRIVLGELR